MSKPLPTGKSGKKPPVKDAPKKPAPTKTEK